MNPTAADPRPGTFTCFVHDSRYSDDRAAGGTKNDSHAALPSFETARLLRVPELSDAERLLSGTSCISFTRQAADHRAERQNPS